MLVSTFSRFGLLAVGLVLSGACRAPRVASSNLLDARGVRTTGRTSDRLASVEIQLAEVYDAHEAVVRLRPEFLRRRSRPSADDPGGAVPMVYVNGVREGGPEMLRTIPAWAVVEIRYLSPSAASDEFGPYHAAGVIAVRTRR